MVNFLIIAAILPIIALCFFIYTKDKNKEPKKLLALIFFLGFLSVIPIIICELLFGAVFPMDNTGGFIPVFINVFFGVALFEEFFKWLVVKLVGYNNKEFDEVFDIIVYSVFASLGFACFENIMYVISNGFVNALLRALLAIPGHTCFAISMGFFLSKAKVAQISGNKSLYTRNMLLSLFIPMILHTFYDAFLFNVNASTLEGAIVELIPFAIFYLGMVVTCFLTVDRVAKIQQNLTVNIDNGTIIRNEDGYITYHIPTNVSSPIANSNPTQNVQPQATTNGVFPDNPVSIPVITPTVTEKSVPMVMKPLNYCPVCGKSIKDENFCGKCGFKLK